MGMVWASWASGANSPTDLTGCDSEVTVVQFDCNFRNMMACFLFIIFFKSEGKGCQDVLHLSCGRGYSDKDKLLI